MNEINLTVQSIWWISADFHYIHRDGMKSIGEDKSTHTFHKSHEQLGTERSRRLINSVWWSSMHSPEVAAILKRQRANHTAICANTYCKPRLASKTHREMPCYVQSIVVPFGMSKWKDSVFRFVPRTSTCDYLGTTLVRTVINLIVSRRHVLVDSRSELLDRARTPIDISTQRHVA